jgi:hypothetical protein
MRVEPAGRWRVALAGLIALSVAMGIGRFAFTPLLPLMLADGVIDLPGASWLASVNYVGYLLGALLCTFQPWIWSRVPGLPAVHAAHWVRGGLLATAVLTLGMGLHVPLAWPLLRFAAGLASAMVFVYGSGWCAARLARLGAPQLGGVMFAGPGVGIIVSGLLTGRRRRAGTSSAARPSCSWLRSGASSSPTTFSWRPALAAHRRSRRPAAH